ncbi:MAG: anion permease [Saprospiraceae bacterium]|nr:anion permease [Saprospiraceae bacterium]
MAFAIIAATGMMHISVAGIIGVILMILSGSVRMDDIYKNVEWRVIFLIATMMPLGLAMDDKHTGAATWIANLIVNIAGPYGPYVVMGCLLLVVTLITEVMSNAAAAVLIAPIGDFYCGGDEYSATSVFNGYSNRCLYHLPHSYWPPGQCSGLWNWWIQVFRFCKDRFFVECIYLFGGILFDSYCVAFYSY